MIQVGYYCSDHRTLREQRNHQHFVHKYAQMKQMFTIDLHSIPCGLVVYLDDGCPNFQKIETLSAPSKDFMKG